MFRVDLAFGDRAGALTILERAFAHRNFYLLTGAPGCDPEVEILRSEPRYVALMRSAGIQICHLTDRWPIGKPPA